MMAAIERIYDEERQKDATIAKLQEALKFYARHEHWMAIHESPDTPNRLLVANGRAAEAGHGWEEAEAALSGTANDWLERKITEARRKALVDALVRLQRKRTTWDQVLVDLEAMVDEAGNA